jgi:hypothetical protein
MHCKQCDDVLNEWESRDKDPENEGQYLDLCGGCRQWSYGKRFTEENPVDNEVNYLFNEISNESIDDW